MSVEYLNKREAAAYIKISLATLERLMNQGLPHIKLERRVLFRKRDIDAFLEKRLVK